MQKFCMEVHKLNFKKDYIFSKFTFIFAKSYQIYMKPVLCIRKPLRHNLPLINEVSND